MINSRINLIAARSAGQFRRSSRDRICEALATVQGLQRGRTNARETAPVQPVSDDALAILPMLPSLVADMVRIHKLVGCRPGVNFAKCAPAKWTDRRRSGSTVRPAIRPNIMGASALFLSGHRLSRF